MSSPRARDSDGDDPRDGEPGLLTRLFRFILHPQKTKVDESLAIIRDGLGIEENRDPSAETELTTLIGPQAAPIQTEINVLPTESMARALFYAPDMDGQADPGEVVWIWAPTDGPGSPPRERAMVVVGRTRTRIANRLRNEFSWA